VWVCFLVPAEWPNDDKVVSLRLRTSERERGNFDLCKAVGGPMRRF